MGASWAKGLLKAVLKLGGFAFGAHLETRMLAGYADVIGSLLQDHRLVIITGAGELARRYISAARALRVSEALCDEVGIAFTRINAYLLMSVLGDLAYPGIPASVDELRRYFASNKAVVMGGLQPGHSTNAVAALAAEAIGADVLLNATDVEGLYTADPKKDPAAKILREATVEEVKRILADQSTLAGEYELMDPVALAIIERSRIPTWIFDGRDPENVRRILAGEKVGTKIIVKEVIRV